MEHNKGSLVYILFPPPIPPAPRDPFVLIYIYIYICVYELIAGAFSDSKCDGAGSPEIGISGMGGGEGRRGDGRRGFDNIRFYILLHNVVLTHTYAHKYKILYLIHTSISKSSNYNFVVVLAVCVR
jgi:hypothetical protein